MNFRSKAVIIVILAILLGFIGSLGRLSVRKGNPKSPLDLPETFGRIGLPTMVLGKLADPGNLETAPRALQVAEPFAAHSAVSNYAARKQRLEAIVEQQFRLNQEDLLRSAHDRAATNRDMLMQESQQTMREELVKLNTQYAMIQREQLQSRSSDLLNKQLGMIALQKSGPLFPNFKGKDNEEELHSREEDLKRLQEAQSAALAKLSKGYQESSDRIVTGRTETVEALANKEQQRLEHEALQKSEQDARRLREHLSRSFNMNIKSVDSRSATGSAVAAMNARGRAADARAASLAAGTRDAAQKAQKARGAMQQRMSRVAEIGR